MNLTDATQFCKSRNAFSHNRSLARSVLDFLNADWARHTSVDDTLVIFDGDELPFIVKNGPVFLDEVINFMVTFMDQCGICSYSEFFGEAVGPR